MSGINSYRPRAATDTAVTGPGGTAARSFAWSRHALAALVLLTFSNILTACHDHGERDGHETAPVDCAICMIAAMEDDGAPPPAHHSETRTLFDRWTRPPVLVAVTGRRAAWTPVRGPPAAR